MTETTSTPAPTVVDDYLDVIGQAMVDHHAHHAKWREAHEAGDFETADAELMIAHDMAYLTLNLVMTALNPAPPEGYEEMEPAEDFMDTIGELDSAAFGIALSRMFANGEVQVMEFDESDFEDDEDDAEDEED